MRRGDPPRLTALQGQPAEGTIARAAADDPRPSSPHALDVAVLSYPMFTQVIGGLEIQVLETIEALNAIGCRARLIDPYREKLVDFDLVHVFGGGSGNHSIVRHANLVGRPVVLSPLIRPYWNRTLGRHARGLDRIVQRLTRWRVSTEYADLRSGLTHADHLFALGEIEKTSIVEAFGVAPERIDVVPNGIPRRFFEARPEAFRARFGIEAGFVLCVGSIDPHKNPLGLARALAAGGRRLVVIGPCEPEHRSYLDELVAQPGVSYLGPLAYADPLLASAYAAADVFCLASASEVMPLCVLEALAAGTPAVVTRHHSMNTSTMAGCLIEIDPHSPAQIASAVDTQARADLSIADCRSSVSHLTWDAAARILLMRYQHVVRASQPEQPHALGRGGETPGGER